MPLEQPTREWWWRWT